VSRSPTATLRGGRASRRSPRVRFLHPGIAPTMFNLTQFNVSTMC
jgi:hypothetical protein